MDLFLKGEDLTLANELKKKYEATVKGLAYAEIYPDRCQLSFL